MGTQKQNQFQHDTEQIDILGFFFFFFFHSKQLEP